MRRPTIAAASIIATLVLSAGAVSCGDDDDKVTDDERDRASQAALEDVGEGRVTDVDKGDDDDSYAYEVEVTLDNGQDVDVQLDDDFKVLNPSR